VVADVLLPPLTGYRALAAWQPAPLVYGVLGAVAGGYLAGAWQVRRRHPRRPWPVSRGLAFFFGLAVIAVATAEATATARPRQAARRRRRAAADGGNQPKKISASA
jgi:cytochrome c oxidase assembly factor CtaG